MVPTDEELDDRRQHVADLRERIEAAKADSGEALREREREIEGARLDAETANLEIQLAEVLAAGNKKAVEAGSSDLLATHETALDNLQDKADAMVETQQAQADAAKAAAGAKAADPELANLPQDEIDRRAAEAKAAEQDAAKEQDNGNGGNS